LVVVSGITVGMVLARVGDVVRCAAAVAGVVVI